MKSLFVLFFMCVSFLSAQNIPLYVGTYTNGESEGIYYYDFNTSTGELTNKKLAAKITSPSFLAISSDKKNIYAVSEVNNGATKSGTINAFTILEGNTLELINSESSNGGGSCHVSLNESNNMLAVSNYSGGTISLHQIDDTGSLNPAFKVIDNNIPGIPSHAHSAKFFKSELFIADLGRNFLSQYSLDSLTVKFLENYKMAPKAGPRHFEITNSGEYIYVINELNATITTLKRNVDLYYAIETVITTRHDYISMNACADIHLSPDENFLYGSNRGENTIVVYKRNKKTGKLYKAQSVSVEGNWPRNFTITPNGKFLLVANQKSNNISVFKINKRSGNLSFMYSKKIAAPVCLVF